MQRLFSMFPHGGPGIALFVLRASVLASFVAVAIRHSTVASNPAALAAAALVSLCFAAGLGTPVISALAGAVAAADLLLGPLPRGYDLTCVLLLDATALAVLGPGAYSVDARLFGRRVTVVLAPTHAAKD